MDIKFMKTKKIVIPVMAAVILVSQLTGCAAVSSNEMLDMLNEGQSIVLDVNEPTTYTMTEKSDQKTDVKWVKLDQLKTFNDGFRQGFDELFKINTITDGIGGKQGCLYVISSDGNELRSGNTTIEDALRNKTFVDVYWKDAAVQDGLVRLANKAYSDVDDNSSYATEASLNAYYNLFDDSSKGEFNATQSVSREEFYTAVFKSVDGVKELNYFPSTDSFAKAVGGDTPFTMYAKQVADLGFLSTSTKSLNKDNISAPISRCEAVYMLVQQNFSDLYEKATDKDVAFSDTKSAGDLALDIGFKEEVKKERVNSETGKVEKYEDAIGKDQWQAYTLAYMFKNPDKGMQSELYRAMVVAKNVGMIDGSESRWDEALSKSEAIELIVNTHLAKNDVYGYLTSSEYARMDAPDDLSPDTEQEYEVSAPFDFDKAAQDAQASEVTLADLTAEQIEIFKTTSQTDVELVKAGTLTLEELDLSQDDLIDVFIIEDMLPINGVKLFHEWKETNGFYEQFKEAAKPSQPAPQKQPEQSKPAPTPQKQPEQSKPAPTPQKQPEQSKPAPAPQKQPEQATPAPKPAPTPAPPAENTGSNRPAPAPSNQPVKTPQQEQQQQNSQQYEDVPPPMTEEEKALASIGGGGGGGIIYWDNGMV